ncbi:MAG: alpha-hydroxy acid oxidase [Pelagibacteraceae bacterium]|jgi:L-lactate dehydrogenase (cytochrome)|nr:alpha-hydroxy-acid oxidizing enzyme [Candidatus Pelagibacter sp.]MAH54598.1 alpha-hydroxy-acid oxidizing enzyme [Candidatus Pelagibacter sp.]MDP6680801.1 alpha-hydroxy acid oxidase [Pelagibacteraceae bacterium]MDP6710854.1 alpha-hydroxy acid oxidase [Pelagibacteraceae bacterium]|tara:strand:- start:3080 stop:4234 length:1155 start_codon:yes stop_codon:yes gene_type:complete
MKLKNCYNFDDFRKLAKQNLPSPIFHYIDGGADDEVTLNRNTDSFNDCDLIPNVLSDVSNVDLSTTVLGQKIDFPLFLAATAMHRLYHHHGERATAKAAEKMGTMFGISTMATVSIEEIAKLTSGPKLFQLYIHKDKGLTDNLIERCKQTGFNSMCLTVDTLVAGNRERDRRTGFTTPPKLTLSSLLSFALHPSWTLNNLLHEKFKLANLIHMTDKGSSIDKSVIDYINEQFDTSMNWKDAEYCVKKWGGPFALKGVMSVEDAKKAIDIGCSAIMISNHGGRQLDGSRAPFDQLAEIVDAVGDKIEVILDGGIRRGTHVLKALALGAKACSFGKGYLFALGAGGQKGVEAVLEKMKAEIERDMILMGCRSIKELSRSKIAFRKN